MAIVFLISAIAQLVLRIFIFLLWGRFILDWVRVLNPRFRPSGPLLVLIEIVYSITDPPIKMFRRLLPPIRLGQVQIDLGWGITLIVCLILLAILP